MTKTIIFSAAVALGLFACGDDNKAPDAPRSIDAPGIDAPAFPAAPTVGTQIDRMGRPAINTALNHVFVANGSAKTAAKDAYNQDSGPTNWATMFGPEFAGNAAILDALDKGLLPQTTGTPLAASVCSTTTATPCSKDSDCPATEHCKVWHCLVATTTTCGSDGDCTAPDVCAGQACGNQVFYNGMPAGQRFNPVAASYASVAGLLTDDELYVDTTQTTCQQYLAVEFNNALPSLHLADCGGRTPSEDVMSLTYSLVAAGPSGLDPTTLQPQFKAYGSANPVTAHGDLSSTFPYLGSAN